MYLPLVIVLCSFCNNFGSPHSHGQFYLLHLHFLFHFSHYNFVDFVCIIIKNKAPKNDIHMMQDLNSF